MSKIRMLRKEAQVALPNSGETYTAEDGTVSMVLDDEHNDHYEPNEQEVNDYAEWLGMSLPEDEELLWIAKEGLKAPLPKEWKPCKTDTAEVYYFNFKTGDSIWDHPMDDHFKRKFKTEKDRLAKKKLGVEEETALSKLPQRSNVIFTESGVIQSEDSGSNSSTTGVKPSLLATKGSTLKGNGSFGSLNSAYSSKVASPLPEFSEKVADKADKGPSKFGVTTTKSMNSAKGSEKGTKAVAMTDSLGDSIPLPDSPDEMTLDDSPSLRNTASSAAVKRKKDRAELLEKATPVPSPTPTPTPDPKPVARITSEAEKALEAKVKKELESTLEEDLGRIARNVQGQIQSLAIKHKEAVANVRSEHEAAVKRIGRKVDSELDDDLTAKQRSLEASAKSAIKSLQDEVDELRDSLKRLNTKVASAGSASSSDMSEAVADAQRVSKAAVSKKVAAIEDEIDEIRERHRKKQSETITKAQSSLEEAVETATANAAKAAKAELNEKLEALDAQHAAEVKRLTRQAEEEMDDERSRMDRSTKEQSSTLIAELTKRKETMVAAATEAANSQVTVLGSRFQSDLDELSTTHQAAISRLQSQAGGDDDSVSSAIAGLDRGAASMKQALLATFEGKVSAGLAKLQDARVAAMAKIRNADASEFPELSNVQSATDDGEAAAQDARQIAEAEGAQKEAAMRGRYTNQVSDLESRIEALEASVAKDGDLQSKRAAEMATRDALEAWVKEVTLRRLDEEREYSIQKDEVLQRIEASRSAAGPTSPNRRGNPDTPKREAAGRARLEVENTFHDQARTLRNTCREQKTACSMDMADSLAADERAKRRSIDSEVTASVGEWKQLATKAMLREVDDAVKPSAHTVDSKSTGPVSSSSGESEDEEFSATPAESDDEQAVLATAHLPPVPNVAFEVQRRLKDIMLEYERREANLRASMRSGVANSAHLDPTMAVAVQSRQELLARQQSVQQARQEWRGGDSQRDSQDPALASMFGQLATMIDGMSNRVASLENSPVGARRQY